MNSAMMMASACCWRCVAQRVAAACWSLRPRNRRLRSPGASNCCARSRICWLRRWNGIHYVEVAAQSDLTVRDERLRGRILAALA